MLESVSDPTYVPGHVACIQESLAHCAKLDHDLRVGMAQDLGAPGEGVPA
jgi:hypothetical protein